MTDELTDYIVIIERKIITRVAVKAKSTSDARRIINDYGPDLAAVDMSTHDEVTAKIKAVVNQ